MMKEINMKYEGRNYFETHEPEKRLVEPHDFEMLKEILRESEVAFRKEQIRFELYKIQRLNNGGVSLGHDELLENYKDKEKFLEAQKKWRRDSIMMEMYLEAHPYVMFYGDYTQWEDIYEQRYKDPKRTFSDEDFK